MNEPLEPNRHPCFDEAAKGAFGRAHLPVAPLCNIKCNYCDRRYDCVNESRPGVSSAVLQPHQAQAYMERALQAEPRLSVAGIAGPGDPLANAEATLETILRIKRARPELLLCLATNGLALPAHAATLIKAGLSHLTLTVNAVDPAIGQNIYAWVRDGKVVYRGLAGAELLLARQEEGLALLKDSGVKVKINTIVIPGVNDGHVERVARWAAARGAHLMNLMPLFPNQGTAFGHIPEPPRPLMERLRAACEIHLPQMRHCTRCRADAVGLLGQDQSPRLAGCLSQCAKLAPPADAARPFVAVASREGVLVNLHLGQAERFQIWGPTAEGFELLDTRPAPPAGGGEARWRRVAELLADCRAVLCSGVGQTPLTVLAESGLAAVEVQGFILEGLKRLYAGEDLSALRLRRSGGGCAAGGKGRGGGDGLGCM